MGNASDRISERSYSASPDLTSKLPHCKIIGCASVSGRYSAAYMTQAHDGQWRFTISEVIGYKPRVAAWPPFVMHVCQVYVRKICKYCISYLLYTRNKNG